MIRSSPHPAVRSRSPLPLLLLALAAAAAPAWPQPDLWIDGPDAVQPGTNREFPDAAIDAHGRSIYVWDAFNAGDARNDIYLRRFARDGAPLADPLQVNTYTDDDQRNPRVAAGLDGSFLVVWRSEEPGPNPADPLGHWVRSRKFDASGAPIGAEQYVNSLNAAVAGGALRVDVAALRGGGYVVVWRSAVGGGTDPGVSIQARLLSAAGVPLGSPIQVNVEEPLAQEYCSVAPLADGGFVVAWTLPGVALRRFAADGSPVTGQIDANAASVTAYWTDLAVAPDGRVALVWREGDTEIRARLFDSTLTPLGDEFVVNDVADIDPAAPRVATYGAGGFLVIWESTTGVGSDPSSRSVEGRRVTGVDQFAGPQQQLNEFEDNAQHQPAIDGSSFWLAVAWQSGDNPEELTDDAILGFGIDLCGPLFCDDFELGTTLRWSLTASP